MIGTGGGDISLFLTLFVYVVCVCVCICVLSFSYHSLPPLSLNSGGGGRREKKRGEKMAHVVDVSSLRFMRAAGWLAVPPDCFLAPDV
jgi:hypothetical protein